MLISLVAQLAQTSYHSLNTPYAFFGLGRTNNYIENLFVGSTKKEDNFINMEGVIPNSKLVIIPSPPGQKTGWKRVLFLRPGDWIPWVTLTLILSTIILAIIVFVLHLNDKVCSYEETFEIKLLISHYREQMKWRDAVLHIISILMRYNT